MTRLVIEDAARTSLLRFAKDDPDGVGQVRRSIRLLVDDPGSFGVHRIHVGLYRVMYEVDEDGQVLIVSILHVGRAGL